MRHPVIIRLRTTNDNYHVGSPFCHGGAARHESSAASDRLLPPARSLSADEAVSSVRCPGTNPAVLRGWGGAAAKACGRERAPPAAARVSPPGGPSSPCRRLGAGRRAAAVPPANRRRRGAFPQASGRALRAAAPPGPLPGNRHDLPKMPR